MKKLLLFVTAVAMLSGCASMSTMQTARTTEKGELAYSVGGGYVSTKMPINWVLSPICPDNCLLFNDN